MTYKDQTKQKQFNASYAEQYRDNAKKYYKANSYEICKKKAQKRLRDGKTVKEITMKQYGLC